MGVLRLAKVGLVVQAGWRMTLAFLFLLFLSLDLRQFWTLCSISELLFVLMFFSFGPFVFTIRLFKMLLPDILLQHRNCPHPSFALLLALCSQLVNSVGSMKFEFIERLKFLSFYVSEIECFLWQELGLIRIAVCYLGAVIQNFPKPR